MGSFGGHGIDASLYLSVLSGRRTVKTKMAKADILRTFVANRYVHGSHVFYCNFGISHFAVGVAGTEERKTENMAMDSHFDSLRRYAIMLAMPGEAAAKQGELTLEALMKNFSDVTVMLQQNLLPLCLVWAGMFALTCWSKGKRERLILSSVFAFALWRPIIC